MRQRRAGPKPVAKIRRPAVVAYTTNWEAISKHVATLNNNRCTKCGTLGSVDNKLRCHHIIPVSKGGKTILWNLTTVCDNCHEKQPGHSHLRHK